MRSHAPRRMAFSSDRTLSNLPTVADVSATQWWEMAAIAVTRAVEPRRDSALWTRTKFAVLMIVTLVLHTTGLDRNGLASSHFAVALQAGTRSLVLEISARFLNHS